VRTHYNLVVPIEPPVALNPDEEIAWRALAYLVTHLSRVLEQDLAKETNVTLSEYVVLVHLSEAEHRCLRIGDLAVNSDLSPSRMSRLVDEMARHGYVTKNPCSDDGRSMLATLTPHGMKTLKKVYPAQLRNVRKRVFDLLSPDDVLPLGGMLGRIRDGLESPAG